MKRPVYLELYDLILSEMEQKGVKFSEQVLGPLLWIRAEVKPGELRSPVTPSDAKKLLQAGFRIAVEKSDSRCFSDDEFRSLGCDMVEAGSWVSAPHSAIIFGLKELPDFTDGGKSGPVVPGAKCYEFGLKHRHVYFAHCFKNQFGCEKLLARFAEGGGFLWDLEFLTDDRNCRVAAFGRSAGIVGMALGVMAYAVKKLGQQMPSISSFSSSDDLAAFVKEKLHQVKSPESITIIGALGRCGRGAAYMANLLGLSHAIKSWDLAETNAGGPFPVLLDSDIIVNCICLGDKQIAPFVTKELLLSNPNCRLEVLADVSCDYPNPNNPFPVYAKGTTLTKPVLEIELGGNKSLHVVSIDHLPTVIPRESSSEFSQDILPYLYHLFEPESSPVFKKAGSLFSEKLSQVVV